MANNYAPAAISLATGKIRRGDTIEPWTFSFGGIPDPEAAIVKFSLHLGALYAAPLVELDSVTSGQIQTEVEDGRLNGTVPLVNIPAVGTLFWELQIRVPTVSAFPAGSVWTRTMCAGRIVSEQDGADNTII